MRILEDTKNVKKVYAHYRLQDPESGYLHHAGGVTIYGEWNHEKGKLVAMGAVCMPNDNYSYKLGRTIAEGRFKVYHNTENPVLSINTPRLFSATTEEEVHDMLEGMAEQLAAYPIYEKHQTDMKLRRYYRSTKEFERAA